MRSMIDPTYKSNRDRRMYFLNRNGETYVFVYNDDQVEEVIQRVGKAASDSSLSFSWYDVAVASQMIRSAVNERNKHR